MTAPTAAPDALAAPASLRELFFAFNLIAEEFGDLVSGAFGQGDCWFRSFGHGWILPGLPRRLHVFDDAPGIVDDLVTVDKDRHALLAGQLLDLGTLLLGERDLAVLELDTGRFQGPGSTSAGAQMVGRRGASVEDWFAHDWNSNPMRGTPRFF